MKNAIELVRDFSLEQAKFYLKEAKEFYPFGTILRKNGELSPVGVDLGTDFPDVNEVIKVLESSIIRRIDEKEIVSGAVGTDIFINSLTGNKKSAIQIKCFDENNKIKIWNSEYVIIDDDFYYKDLVSAD